jgi:hypothetical protein
MWPCHIVSRCNNSSVSFTGRRGQLSALPILTSIIVYSPGHALHDLRGRCRSSRLATGITNEMLWTMPQITILFLREHSGFYAK